MAFTISKNWKRSVGILLIILLASIIFAILYPFYSINEGLASSLTGSDITNLQKVLQKYSDTANDNCQKTNNAILSLGSSDPQTMQINSAIKNNTSNTACTIVDQISNIATDSGVVGAINTCYGNNYAAVLNLLNSINSSPLKQALADDPNFAQIVKTQTTNPSVSGQNSTYNMINGYVMGAISTSG
jgi:hypothetical protein